MLALEVEENEVKGVCLPLSWQKQQREETEACRVPRSNVDRPNADGSNSIQSRSTKFLWNVNICRMITTVGF